MNYHFKRHACPSINSAVPLLYWQPCGTKNQMQDIASMKRAPPSHYIFSLALSWSKNATNLEVSPGGTTALPVLSHLYPKLASSVHLCTPRYLSWVQVRILRRQ